MAAQIDLSRDEIAQTIITVATALVAARDLEPGEAAARAVAIIQQAFEAADTLMYECGRLPSGEA